MSSCFTDLVVASKHEGRCRNLYICSLQCVSRKTHVLALVSSGSVCSTFALVHTVDTSVESVAMALCHVSLYFLSASFALCSKVRKAPTCNSSRLSFKPKWCHKYPISGVKSVEGGSKPSFWLVIHQQAPPCWFLYLLYTCSLLTWVYFFVFSNVCSFIWLSSKLETHSANWGRLAFRYPWCRISS